MKEYLVPISSGDYVIKDKEYPIKNSYNGLSENEKQCYIYNESKIYQWYRLYDFFGNIQFKIVKR